MTRNSTGHAAAKIGQIHFMVQLPIYFLFMEGIARHWSERELFNNQQKDFGF